MPRTRRCPALHPDRPPFLWPQEPAQASQPAGEVDSLKIISWPESLPSAGRGRPTPSARIRSLLAPGDPSPQGEVRPEVKPAQSRGTSWHSCPQPSAGATRTRGTVPGPRRSLPTFLAERPRLREARHLQTRGTAVSGSLAVGAGPGSPPYGVPGLRARSAGWRGRATWCLTGLSS